MAKGDDEEVIKSIEKAGDNVMEENDLRDLESICVLSVLPARNAMGVVLRPLWLSIKI